MRYGLVIYNLQIPTPFQTGIVAFGCVPIEIYCTLILISTLVQQECCSLTHTYAHRHTHTHSTYIHTQIIKETQVDLFYSMNHTQPVNIRSWELLKRRTHSPWITWMPLTRAIRFRISCRNDMIYKWGSVLWIKIHFNNKTSHSKTD